MEHSPTPSYYLAPLVKIKEKFHTIDMLQADPLGRFSKGRRAHISLYFLVSANVYVPHHDLLATFSL